MKNEAENMEFEKLNVSLSQKEKEIEILLEKNKNLQLRNDYLEEQYQIFRAILFGRKTEKRPFEPISVLQPSLFDEPTATSETPSEIESEKTITVGNHQRKKPGRRPLPADLPRKDSRIELSEEEKHLSCGCVLVPIGEKVTEELDIIPAKIQVIRTIRVQYVRKTPEGRDYCDTCDDVGAAGAMVLAPLPPKIIPQGIVTPGLLAHVATAKYVDALPLYRQEQQFQRLGLDINRGTLSNWMLLLGDACQILIEFLFKEILAGPVINMDETPVQVFREPGRSNTTKSYMWVCRGGTPEKPCIVFQYFPTRSGAVASKLLSNYKGFLQTDGYIGYETVGEREGIIHLGCWTHVRRKFVDVLKGTKGTNKASVAKTMVDYIGELYGVEKRARAENLTPEKIVELRAVESKPILDKIKKLLDEKGPTSPPKSLLGKAIYYALNQWPRLEIFLQDGRLRLDNNLAENSIRPFAIGRKNWMFMGSPRGANAGAGLYSLIETAKANGIEPYAYLRFIFAELPKASSDDEIRALLPQHLDRARLIVA